MNGRISATMIWPRYGGTPNIAAPKISILGSLISSKDDGSPNHPVADLNMPKVSPAHWETADHFRLCHFSDTEVPMMMKRRTITGFVAVALLAAATTTAATMRSRSPSAVLAAGMMSLQDLHPAAVINKLPIENFEDMSLVYSTATKW
jgi:hypothetical protein